MIYDIVAVILIAAGIVFFLGAAVGLIRFPDFYTRMHAAGKGDTLSSLLVILGFAIHEFRHFDGSGDVIVFLKLLAICAFIMLTSPTSTHALMDAGYEDGIEPVIGEGGENALAETRKTRKKD
ncbi:MAG: monovalent cation/H(+) antiporter subunit G [Verrucomicrobiae bacterium]|nr:monovalent cation/H(+) antiporter subunit G [Verrucomicrobiae bacterium]